MCGIAGIVAPRGGRPERAHLEAMLSQLAHRGPDGEGIQICGRVGLGHRRLAVLDPGATGQQPMSYENGRFIIVFNGEIYNFLELKATLAQLGYQFQTDSDTEAILAAFACWGEKCQLHFNGMWAFAIWDKTRRRLFLSRDRFGVKPLFYSAHSDRFAFSSEMKGFLPLPWLPLQFDEEAIGLAIAQPAALEATERCIFKGVRRLQPGSSITLRDDGQIELRRWWNTAEHLVRVPATFPAQVRQFQRLFFDSVRLRLRSDIPVACTLSGGLDSSAVTCTAARVRKIGQGLERHPPCPPVAYVASYPNSSHDESKLALAIARHAGFETVCVQVDSTATAAFFDEFLFQTEEVQSPHIGPWLLYRAMRDRGIRVSLDGHGGDELLAGYKDHVRWARDAALARFPRVRQAAVLTATLKAMAGGAYRAPGLRDYYAEGIRWYRRRRGAARGQDFPGVSSEATSPIRFLRTLGVGDLMQLESPAGRGSQGGLSRLLFADFHYRALPTILRDFDRFSMASGVEIRSPFLDWRLVCFCLSLPPTAVLHGGFTKRVLREAMRGIVPEEARLRRGKIPYKSPLSEWWSGSLRELALDTVDSASFLASEIWNGHGIRRLVHAAPPGGRFEHALVVMRFVAAQRLIEMFGTARTQLIVRG